MRVHVTGVCGDILMDVAGHGTQEAHLTLVACAARRRWQQQALSGQQQQLAGCSSVQRPPVALVQLGHVLVDGAAAAAIAAAAVAAAVMQCGNFRDGGSWIA